MLVLCNHQKYIIITKYDLHHRHFQQLSTLNITIVCKKIMYQHPSTPLEESVLFSLLIFYSVEQSSKEVTD